MAANSNLSKDFFDLVKSIGESRSKQEEDKIISNEVRTLKSKMAAKDVPSKKMKEYLIRLIYVEMLGHDASFGHIHAINMVTSKKLLEKRVGYLAVTLALHPDHSFMLLLINSLLLDLRSDNFLEVSVALSVVCKLVNSETLPPLLPLVAKLLDHKQANIRKKAVVCLHRFYEIDNNSLVNLGDKVRKVLCDKDPSVMGASLCLFEELTAHNAVPYKDLTPSFVSILKQVTEHRLPRDYDYHRMPAPWIQLKLLRILANLGASDRRVSEGMYEILQEVIKRADVGINVGYAIVYECVRTITSIYPSSALIEEAALSISRFLTSDNHNLKYLGVTALAAIVQINPKYAAEHQLVVIDCLEDPDETLKHKTLDLLYSMTNPANVLVIVDKLLNFLKQTNDVYLKTELVSRVNQLAEKYSPSNSWYIQTMSTIFELGGDLVKPEIAHNLMRLIAEADTSDQTADIRLHAVDTYVELLRSKKILPDIMIQVISWVLGEFAYLSRRASVSEIAELVANLCEKQFDHASTRAWLLNSLQKLVAQLPSVPPQVRNVVSVYQTSLHVDLQQRAHEFVELAKTPETMVAVLPAGATSQPIQVDETLSFLDGYVAQALANGAPPYVDKSQREEQQHPVHDEGHKKPAGAGLIYQVYNSWNANGPAPAAAPTPSLGPSPGSGAGSGIGGAGTVGGGSPAVPAAAPASLSIKKAGPWSTKGWNANELQATQSQPVQSQPQPQPQVRPVEPVQERAPEPAPRKAEPAKPRELTEKEKLAQAMFSFGPAPTAGGAGGTGAAKSGAGAPASGAGAGVRKAAPAAAAAPATKAPAPVVANPANVANAPNAKTQTSQPAKPPIDLFAVDIFDGSGAGTGGAAPAQATSAPAAASGGSQTGPAPPKKENALVDLLGDVFSGPAVTPGPSAPSGGLGALGGLGGLDFLGGPQPTPAFGGLQGSAPQNTGGLPNFGAQVPGSNFGGSGPSGLGLGLGSSAPSVGGAPFGGVTTGPPSGNNSSSIDIFSGLGNGTGSSGSSGSSGNFPSSGVAQPVRPATSVVSGGDDPFASLLGGVGGSGGGAKSSGGSTVVDPTKFGAAGATEAAVRRLAGFQLSQETVAVADQVWHISFQKALGADRTAVVVYITNKRSSPIPNVTLEVGWVGGLTVVGESDGTQTAKPNSLVSTSIQIPQINAAATFTEVLNVGCTDGNWASGKVSVQCVVGTSGGGLGGCPAARAVLALGQVFSLRDFLRPAPLNTSAFGNYWKQFTAEAKLPDVGSSVSSPNELISRVGNLVGLGLVETKGAENIIAGRLVALGPAPVGSGAPGGTGVVPVNNTNLILLVHAKLKQGQVDVMVRSKFAPLSQTVAQFLAQILR